MATNFSAWMGKSVVMNIVNGTSRVALNCRVVHESDELLRVRISEQWDVDIYKDMVSGIELDNGVAQYADKFFEY